MDILLPNHLPEVGACVFKRALGYNVVVLTSTYGELQKSNKNNNHTSFMYIRVHVGACLEV